jgi:predicted 2-oxoglutarate/Fe(II)-dependent dioxygenase YbiX
MKPYLTLSKAVPKELCNLAIKDFRNKKFEGGTVYDDLGNLVAQDIRTGTVHHAADGHWLEIILGTLGQMANQAGEFGYAITGTQPLQIANYEAGEKYDWHSDTSLMIPAGQVMRKLTLVAQLSPREDFTGGGLYIDGVNDSVLVHQGDVAVFPAYLRHKAETVATGTRTTAVMWFTGPAFT